MTIKERRGDVSHLSVGDLVGYKDTDHVFIGIVVSTGSVLEPSRPSFGRDVCIYWLNLTNPEAKNLQWHFWEHPFFVLNQKGGA